MGSGTLVLLALLNTIVILAPAFVFADPASVEDTPGYVVPRLVLATFHRHRARVSD
ncbi:hypothetical protein [Serratia marcescens]|uniref:hypothetical protein n=1 Tax=Serratia marcescens TaxID=615 RepID=UPI0013DD252B|nr:hypothetical protein [Serratia marcescens]